MKSPWFKEEHEMFRRTVRKFMETEFAPHADEWEEAKDFPNWVFKRAGEMGFLGLTFPEEVGGLGCDYFYKAVYCEELPRSESGSVNMALLVQSDMATPPIHILGTPEQKEEYLIPMLKGDKIGALGVTEPNAGSDVAAMRTTARKDGDHYLINGTKIFITNGARADVITLAAKTAPDRGYHGISLFLVDTDLPGFSVSRRLEKMGMHASDTTELRFEDVRVHKSRLLGPENQGFYEVMINFQGERLVAALTSAAGAAYILDKTMKYIKEREVFGKPLSKFQVTRHKIVDMVCELETVRQYLYYCCWLFDQNRNPAREVSIAKIMATETALRVINQCLQLHGGYGYMKEYKIERAYRDARLGTIGGGATEVMKEVVGRMEGL
jgi:alkylation response protein AidB-like acyl-CoA dehydrogenase